MAEDISAQARLAVEVTSMGSLLAVIASLMVIGLSYLNYFENNLINAYQNITHVTVNKMQTERFVTSANVYKLCSSLESSVKSVSISQSGGTLVLLPESSDPNKSLEYLMRNPSRNYRMLVTKINGMYSFQLQEVN